MIRKNLSLALALVASTAACNDTSLVDAPLPDPCAAPSAASHALTAEHSIVHRAPANRRFVPPHAVVQHGGTVPPSSLTAVDLLTAMGVDPAGIESAELFGHPTAVGRFPSLGTIYPSEGNDFAWLSTGVAGAGTPWAVAPSGGTQEGTDFEYPGCGTGEVHDCVMLRYRFVVPEEVHSIRFDFSFFSAEYPEYVGEGYNDTFLVSMSSPSHTYANISFDQNGNPITIDSAFFDEPCERLAGTGFDIRAEDGTCDAGGTGRLTTQAPVEPGETVTLTFSITDSGDGIYDSAVMLDDLRASGQSIEEPETGEDVPGC